MSGPGGVIIRNIAKQMRAEATTKTQEVHGWFGRKWLEIRAVFGFHA